MSSGFLEKGREVLSSQSFSAMLGTHLSSLEKGAAVLELDIRTDFQQNYGFVHGGVLSYMADNGLTFAGATILGNCVTSEFKINYLKPAMGEKLISRSTVLSSGLRQAVCECKVSVVNGGSEELVAVAQGTIVRIQTT